MRIFESLPVPVTYLLIFLFMYLTFEIGFRFGRYQHVHHKEDKTGSLGSMVGGLLGMLAFVLAFTYSMATSQYNSRKTMVLEEANAIGTAYLRADLIDAADGQTLKRLLKEYVDIRVKAVKSREALDYALKRSTAIHKELWKTVAHAAKTEPGENSSLTVQAINTVIDMHEKRITAALRNHIPLSVWIALIAIIVLTMATIGVQVGLGNRRRLVAVVPLILAFTVLFTLVIDLDHSQKGLLTVDQASMISLQKSMQ